MTTTATKNKPIALQSELDYQSNDELREQIAKLLNERSDVTLDCSQVNYIEISSAQLLLSLKKQQMANGNRFALLNLSESVRESLANNGLNHLTEIFEPKS